MFSLSRKRGPLCAGFDEVGEPCPERVSRIGDRCPGCLASLVASGDPEVRRRLASDAGLHADVLSALAVDTDADVRLAVADRPDTPLVELQRLEQDADHRVRTAASETLSAALTPRAFDDGERGSLFTPEELEALGSPDPTGGEPQWSEPAGRGAGLRALRPPDDRPADHRPRHLAPTPVRGAPMGDLDEVIANLDSLERRLVSLEAALASTRDQLAAITSVLDDLAADPGQGAAGRTAARRVHLLRATGTETGRPASPGRPVVPGRPPSPGRPAGPGQGEPRR
jgi:hypothetical protein